MFTAPAPGDAPDPGGVVVHRIDPAFAYGNAPLIPSLAGISGFDVVHLHYPFIFGSELVLLGRIRRASRSQALLVHYKNRLVAGGVRGALFDAYERTVAPALIRAADRVCVLSADHANSVPYLRRAGANPRGKLIEMPNGVDATEFSPGPDEDWRGSGESLRAALGIPSDAVVAAFVGTLDRAHHFKRVDLAIEAIRVAADERLHLVVAGGGGLQADYRALAAEAGLANRVHFLGHVPHAGLPGVLRACDLFLLTTEPPESFGIVLIEAMASGLPAIASEYPGVRGVVDEGETGFVVARGDSRGVANRVLRLADAPSERERMGAAGRAKAEREWNWPSLVTRMDEAYRQAIEARREKAGSS